MRRVTSHLVAFVIAVFTALGLVLVAYGGSYQETFTGAPPTPDTTLMSTIAQTVHHRNFGGEQFPPMAAQHGANCAAPPATHLITSPTQGVYRCLNHIMTAIQGAPYGAVMLTPAAILDWSGGSAQVRWFQSTSRASARDYTSMWITPFNKLLAIPADSFIDVDLQGQPDQAVTVLLDLFTDRISPDAFGVPKNVCYPYGCYAYHEVHGQPFSSIVVPDSAIRTEFELTITPTTLLLRMPLYNHTLFFAYLDTPLPFNQAMVQFGHHSYSPEKGCSASSAPSVGTGGQVCGDGTTWHWDDIRMEPSIPITLYNATPRKQGGGPGTYRFNWAQPALTNSWLEFSAIGTVDVSYGGAFTRAARQKADHDPAKVSMYLLPVPAGSTFVDVRLSADGGVQSFQWYAQDLHLWIPGAVAPVTPTPTPSSTSTATPTATVSPTATATATTIPTATASPSPTATVTPTATATPALPTPTATATPSPTPAPTPTPVPTGRCEAEFNDQVVQTETRTQEGCRLQ